VLSDRFFRAAEKRAADAALGVLGIERDAAVLVLLAPQPFAVLEVVGEVLQLGQGRVAIDGNGRRARPDDDPDSSA
jgi:hypothetical protein